MPGYIIHLCEGRYIADKLHISKESLPEPLNDFLLGAFFQMRLWTKP